MLSNTCKYGLRSIIYIALEGNDKNVSIKQISEDLDIPRPFLGKIVQSLAKNKILKSTKGPHGGFSLGRNASEITIMDVVKLIDGMDFFETCLIGMIGCTNADDEVQCPIRNEYEPIREQIRELFENTTIEKLADSIKSSSGAIRI